MCYLFQPQDVPVVTLVLEDLTMAQQDNAITTVFGGLEVSTIALVTPTYTMWQ